MVDYKPLDETRNEIRVLSLCPEQAGLVRCRLEHVSLDEALEDYSQFVVSTPPTLSRRNSYDLWHADANDRSHHHHRSQGGGTDTPPDRASAHPRYYRFAWGDYGALSYTWGDQSQTRPILLNDTVFHVGRNLEACLRRLARHPDYADGGLKLWVDAICINQRDLSERGRQVRRMGDIFSRALIVTIWLGELQSTDTTDGMAELQALVSRCRDDSTTKDAVEEALKKEDRELGSALHAAVERLVTVTYWTRTWIIQEKCLGPFNASLLFGPHVFSLIPLRNFLACANNIQGAIRKRESAWQILKLMELAVRHQERSQQQLADAEQQKRADMDDLGLLLMLGRLAHTTDPRDKLYGLLGLLPRYVSRHIEPDYTLPVARVFADFAAALVRGFDTLDLVLAGNSPPASPFASPFVDAVPSWVPDLADRWDPYLWSTNCDATPHHPRPLGLEIEDEGRTLVVKGVVCDVVAGTAPQLGWAAGVLSVLLPAQQIEVEGTTPPPDADLKTAIVRTLHRDATLDCHTAATLLDIPWLDGLRLNAEEEEKVEGENEHEKQHRIQQRRILLARGWGPVLRHANFADFQQFRVRLDALYAPWPGRRFRDFFPRVEEEGDGHLSGERQAAFLAALERHAGIVYPILTTRRGRFGTSIHPARVGDVVAVVPGCYAPVLLRRDEGRGGGVWRSVSHCYVEGLMRGEAMEWLERGEVGLEELRIV
ncbi:Heterokaryon incompatibility protein 6 [Lasiodiplodia hormozganensis]|uniref:Heterokaryon incompatibility protein 6 n=1 Tax=Lasiodiplodia hormozganensis TaxID=869390 RepID=A0AA40CSU8_9PEZI|nr:Heterokaryon incompatibility protein 6 [Lasiodiplodia hormozganensis]